MRGQARLAEVFLFALLVGCQDYYFAKKVPQVVEEASVVVPAAEKVPADILFIVDNSCSMDDEQDNLGTNFDAFIREIAGDGDYRIAIVSTDVNSTGGEKAGARILKYANSPPNMVQSSATTDMNCMDTGIRHSCFRGPGADKTRIIDSRMSADEQRTLFNANVRLGSCGDGEYESGLAAMKAALTQTGTSGCNRDFLRPNANLVVIIVSDEEDQDPTRREIDHFVQFLKSAKGGTARQIRVAVIAGSVDGTARNCRLGSTGQCGSFCQNPPAEGSRAACTRGGLVRCPDGEYCHTGTSTAGICRNNDLSLFHKCHFCSYYNTTDCCTAERGSRYVEFAAELERAIAADNPSITATGCRVEEGKRIGCLIDSVCQEDFSGTLARIARDLVNTSEYTLAPAACNPKGVVAKLNGTPLEHGKDFSVSADGRTLTIIGRTFGPEDKLELFFVVEGCGPMG